MKIIECPRDAMQGLSEFIPTDDKVAYINTLLEVGFDTIDFGSFVSPKAIPQMSDTQEVLSRLNTKDNKTKLLSIIGNKRGAETACSYAEITYLGYPHSVSPTFLKRNLNTDTNSSLLLIEELQEMCVQNNKELVVYQSMAFGNPYGDKWNVKVVEESIEELVSRGVKIISLADTTGVCDPNDIALLFANLVPKYPEVEFGIHLHTTERNWRTKIDAAYENGCMRYDSVILGLGGCPMAEDQLVGNMKTQDVKRYLDEKGVDLGLNQEAFDNATIAAKRTFASFISH